MERRKSIGTTIEAIVKAAAWAWYQHGSGSEGRPMSEYDLTRSHKAPKPTRYKLEAIKTTAQEAMNELSELNSPSPTHTDNSLLDTYEIERISRQLDYYIESSKAENYGRFFAGDRGYQRIGSSPENDKSGMKGKKKSKKTKGLFWLRHAAVCGTKDDVVEPTEKKDDVVDVRGFVGGRRRPEKQGRVANWLPRATHV